MKNYQKSSSMGRRTRSKKPFWIIVALVLLIGGGTVGAIAYSKHKQPEAKTTSKSKTAQNDYTDGDNRQPVEGSGNAQGGAVDNRGDTTSTAPSTATVSSDNGIVTVAGIAKDGLLHSGDALRGTVADKSIAQVQFRIIDTEVGVLGQGQLAVVGGSFSGALSFTAHSDTGRVDVYTLDSMGSEINNVEIPVRFK